MAARTLLALDVGLHHLHAVEASVERGRIVVLRVVSRQLSDLGAEAAPEERGERVRHALNEAGIVARRAVWTLPRERVVMKRLELPGGEWHELPGMVRLAMQQESSLGADAVYDFWVQGGAGGADGAGGAGSARTPGAATRAVWVVGAPAEELHAIARMADAAGIAVERVAPRALGTAALIATLPLEGASTAPDSGGGALTAAFDLATGCAELVAADRTGLLATRGTAVPSDAPDAAVKEALRSWTAFRLSQPDLRPVRALVLGDDSAVAALDQAVGPEIPVAALHAHPDIQRGAQMLHGAWPLAGLLLEDARKGERIDLANPRKSPDVAARKRIRVYAAVAVVLAAYCLGWGVGKKDRSVMEGQRSSLLDEENSARKEYQRIKRDELKARHVEAWLAAQPLWLDTMLKLHGTTPEPAQFLLAGWSGQVDEVSVTSSKEGAFTLPRAVRVSLDVETTDRASVDALREALIAKRDWTVRSTSSEGKAGRKLPIAAELLLLSADAQKGEP